MICPQCHTENKPGRKFCAACGQTLPHLCSQCGFLNDPGDRFCGGCGAVLTSQSPSDVPSSTFQAQDSQPLAPSPVSYTPAHLNQTTEDWHRSALPDTSRVVRRLNPAARSFY
ncbi:MAG: zinc-ribbon domain-containing protein, partial [Deltaproteobacteria bacterium]|nr:zinc-ribbon domain-containing protein [Deltaproteobacteria bacterium]